MISLACHHGLRAPEFVGRRWSAIDWKRADIAVNRLKNGKSRSTAMTSEHSIAIGSPTNTCSYQNVGRLPVTALRSC
jgi:integrase